MRVYKIEYREYEYQCGVGLGRSDYFLTPIRERHSVLERSKGTDEARR